MSDSLAKADRKPTACDKNATPAGIQIGVPLTEKDFRKLEDESWIDRETALAAGLRRFDRFSGAEIVGRKDAGKVDYSGIGFPYFLPGQRGPHTIRLRRDHPEYEVGKNGKAKPFRKYLTAPGVRNRLYFPPKVMMADLSKPDLAIIFTEGEKKTLSLHRLSFHAADLPRFLPIGVPGAWSWRGITGKEYNEDGERVDVVGVISDLDLICWGKRLVLLGFDKDWRTNENVRTSRAALAKELKRRGAIVKFFDIPQEAKSNGVDELIVEYGPESVLERLQAAFDSDGEIVSQYYAQAGSIWRNSTTRDGATRIQLTNFEATISAAITEDDGSEQHRRFEIDAVEQSGKRHKFTVSAAEFAAMAWPIEKIGPQAIVFPNQKDHARTAIQTFLELWSRRSSLPIRVGGKFKETGFTCMQLGPSAATGM